MVLVPQSGVRGWWGLRGEEGLKGERDREGLEKQGGGKEAEVKNSKAVQLSD